MSFKYLISFTVLTVVVFRLFDNYMIELQTNARQYLTPLRVMEYLEQLKNKKEYEKCAAFFIYVIATRWKKIIFIKFFQREGRYES